MGPAYHPAVERILEHFVRLLDAAPAGAADRLLPHAPPPPHAPSTSPPPPPQKSKLAGAVRSLVMRRLMRREAEQGGVDLNAKKPEGALSPEASEAQLLQDVRLVAARLASLGREAICEKPQDLEWLADKAPSAPPDLHATFSPFTPPLHLLLAPALPLRRLPPAPPPTHAAGLRAGHRVPRLPPRGRAEAAVAGSVGGGGDGGRRRRLGR